MAPKQLAIALVTLSLNATLVAAAAPAPSASFTELPAATAGADSAPGGKPRFDPERAAPAEPTTPFRMDVPNPATDEEIKGESGIGVALLILGAVLGVLLFGGAFYHFTFRAWHHERDGVSHGPHPSN